MNRHAHRIIFNPRRGQLMVVAETAAAVGQAGGTRRGLTRVRRHALAALAVLGALAPPFGAACAQIVANPAAPGTQQPSVLQSAGGVPLVNIQTPNAAGVSMNRYSQFDVQRNGAILNNSRKDVPTQLGGWVQGNPWLATGSAGVIVNQVESSKPSLLNGYTEVAGQRAGVVIANPSGISVNGGGFINANSVTLTTGTPRFGAGGALAGYGVQGGRIGVDGHGLDLSGTDYAQLLARAVSVNAGIWASDLRVVTGVNQISADGHSVTSGGAAQGAKPAFAVDVGQLGGMYAGKIFLVGTEAGLGVSNAGVITASSGALTLSVDGKLTNSGTLAASGAGQDVNLNVRGFDNRGTVASQRDITLADSGAASGNGGQINAARQLVANTTVLDNQAGGAITAQRLQIATQTLHNAGIVQQTGAQDLSVSTAALANTGAGAVFGAPLPSTSGGGNSSSSESSAGAGAAPSSAAGGSQVVVAGTPAETLSAGQVHVAQSLSNSGSIVANGATDLTTTQSLVNTGTLNVRNLNASAVFNNDAGQARVQRFAGAQDTFVNRGGHLYSQTDLNLKAGSLDNTTGQIASGGRLTTQVRHGLVNAGGTLSAQGDVSLAAQSIDNSAQGQIASTAGSVSVTADQALDNQSGDIRTVSADPTRTVAVRAAAIDNSDGRITQASAGAMQISATGSFINAAGQIVSNGTLGLSAGELSNNGGTVAVRSGAAVSAGAISNRGGTLQVGGSIGDAPADLTVTSTGAIDNTRGVMAASGGVDVQAVSLDNSVGTVGAKESLAVTVSADLVNTGGQMQSDGDVRIASGGATHNDQAGVISGKSVTVAVGGALSNQAGQVIAAGAVSVQADGVDNRAGGIQGAAVRIQSGDGAWHWAELNNRGGLISGENLNIDSAGVDNAQGTLQATAAGSSLRIASHGGDIANHQSGKERGILSAGDLSVDTQGGTLDNSDGGGIGAVGAATLHAGRIINRGGTIASNAGLQVTSTAASGSGIDNSGGQMQALGNAVLDAGSASIVNAGGTVASNGAVNVQAESLDNSAGRVSGLGALAVTTRGALTNTGGKLQSNGDVTVASGSTANDLGGVISAAGNLDVATGALDNRAGALAADGAVAVSANGVDNRGGVIQGATVHLQSSDGADHWAQLDNHGGMVAARDALAIGSAELDNTQGTLQVSDAGGTLTLNSHGADVTNGQSGLQGGIVSAGSLSLDTQGGTLDNSSGGYIGAVGDATLAAQRVVNRGGTIASNADLGISSTAASGAGIDNGAGAIHAQGHVTLAAAGSSVANAGGMLYADRDLALQSSGPVDNASGTIGAGGHLMIADSRVAAGAALSAATQDIANTAGRIQAGQAVAINGRSVTGDGKIESAGDLTVALASDYTQSADGTLSANGQLSLSSLGNVINQGQIIGGTGAAISAGSIDNQAGAAITSAGTTSVNAAGMITNRGLIDGSDTRVGAGTLDNIGTGRIYGDHVSIAVAVVNNGADGGTGATIAARGDLDIGAGTVNNTGGATLLSLQDMRIGGSLDGSDRATGQAVAINNAGSEIQSGGDMTLSAAGVNNTNPGLVITPQVPMGTVAAPDLYQVPGQMPEDASHFRLFDRGASYPYVDGNPSYRSGDTRLVKLVRPDLFGTYIPQAVTNNLACSGSADSGTTCIDNYSYGAANSPLWARFDMTPPANYINVAPDPTDFGAIGRTDFDGNPYLDWTMGNQTAYNAAVADFNASVAAVTVLDDAITAQNVANNAVITLPENGRTYIAITGVTQAAYQDQVAASTPGKITAGRNLSVNGALNNIDSSVIAGGDIVVNGPVNNSATQGTRTVTTSGTADSVQWSYSGGFCGCDSADHSYAPFTSQISTTFELPTLTFAPHQSIGTFGVIGNGNAGQNVTPDGQSAPGASGVQEIAGVSSASGATATGVPSGNAAAVPAVAQYPGRSASGAAITVRTLTAGPGLPTSSLYVLGAANSNTPLVETDPAFTHRGQWLSSDYMLRQLGADPAMLARRLGDGFYEQQLIQQQVGQLTGARFLGDYTSNDAEYRDLMSAGVTFAQAQGLRPGIALTAEQIAQLTSDIVWLVNEDVILPDGSRQSVLAPRLYVVAQPGDMSATGALVSGRNVLVNTAGEVTNSGTIAGRRTVQIAAGDINDTYGRIIGNQVGLAAVRDINVVGGSIEAAQTLLAHAGRDLNIASTTRTSAGGSAQTSYATTVIDRVGNVGVTGQGGDGSAGSLGGVLAIAAGRDMNLQAAQVNNQAAGSASVLRAGRDVNLTTVNTASAQNIDFGRAGHLAIATSADVGTQIVTQGDLGITAGRNVSATAADVNAGGALSVNAIAGDITVGAGTASQTVDDRYYHETHGFLSSGSSTVTDGVQQTRARGSSVGGTSVALSAGKNIGITGSSVIADQDTSLTAGGDITITAATNTTSERHGREGHESGLLGGGGFGITYGKRDQSSQQQSTSTSAAASTVGAVAGDITIEAGGHYRQTGSDVLAPGGDIAISAQQIDITEAREISQSQSEQHFRQSGITVSLGGGVMAIGQDVAQSAQGIVQSDSRRDQLMNALLLYGKQAELVSAGKAMTNADNVTDAAAASGIKLSISVGISNSDSESESVSNTGRASSVQAGGNVTLHATGSDLTAQGALIRGGQDVTLQAARDINLYASADSASDRSYNSNSSGSLGVSIGAGKGTFGFSVDVAAMRGAGRANSDSTTWNDTHVEAGRNLILQSGGDTNLKGAVAGGRKAIADVGGNLTIQSLQDTATGDMSQQQTGFAMSIPITGATPFSASASSNRQSGRNDYASVWEQSGLVAGNQGFDITVGGHTRLDGAVIASSAAADRNTLQTASLGTSDLQNRMDAEASSSGITLSTSMASGKYAAAMGTFGNLMNHGDAGAHDQSSTTSAISAGQITVGGKTIDTSQAPLVDSNGQTVSTDTQDTSRALVNADLAALQQAAQKKQASNVLLTRAVSTFTDEAYRVMYQSGATVYRVPPGCSDQSCAIPLTEEQARHLAASQDGVIHVSNNGNYNDMDGATKYAQQHASTTNADGSVDFSDKPQNQYVIFQPETNNVLSELLVAGYSKTGLSTTLGLTDAEARTVQIIQDAAANGQALQIDSHSRGTMTTQNAIDYLNANGGVATSDGQNPQLTLHNFGAAQSADGANAGLQQITGNPNAQVIEVTHIKDLVGTKVGGNTPTPSYISTNANGTVTTTTALDDGRGFFGNLWNIVTGTASPHNCSGTSRGTQDCNKQWDNIPKSNAIIIDRPIDYKPPVEIPNYDNIIHQSILLQDSITTQSNENVNQLLKANQK